jgi:hypothetical protein
MMDSLIGIWFWSWQASCDQLLVARAHGDYFAVVGAMGNCRAELAEVQPLF